MQHIEKKKLKETNKIVCALCTSLSIIVVATKNYHLNNRCKPLIKQTSLRIFFYQIRQIPFSMTLTVFFFLGMNVKNDVNSL